jgi:phage protein D
MADPSPIDSINKPISYTLSFNNAPLPISLEIYSITVQKAVNKIGRAQVQILGGDPNMNSFEEAEADYFEPGNPVEIKLGYDQSNTTVFKGIVEKNYVSIRDGFNRLKFKRLLVIDCVDTAIQLANSYTSEIYEDKKDSEIIAALISKLGLTKTIESTTIKHAFLPKFNINDWEFIIQRAKSNGLIVVNSDNTIKVKKPLGKGSPSLTIKHGDGLVSFDGKIDGSGQYQSLEYKGYDPFENKLASAKATEPELTAQGDLTGKKMSVKISPAKNEIIIPQPIPTGELASIANSTLIRSRLKSIYGSLKVKGVNSIDIDSVIKLSGFGSRLDGPCYVTSIEHEVIGGNFYTVFGFGLTEDILSLKKGIDVSNLIPSISGVHIGEVKKIDKDPDNQYRIKVFIPALKTSGEGLWARLTHFYTSSEAGSFFIPEINSQVVVSFINEDPRYPVVLGGLYTKTNKPYSEITPENELKAIVSKEKLTLEFNDKDKVIIIKTSDKNKITMNEKDIKIEDEHGNEITTSKDGILFNSKKEIIITTKDAISINGEKGVVIQGKTSKGVSIKGNKLDLKSDTKISAKGSAVDLESSGSLNIKGANVNIN